MDIVSFQQDDLEDDLLETLQAEVFVCRNVCDDLSLATADRLSRLDESFEIARSAALVGIERQRRRSEESLARVAAVQRRFEHDVSEDVARCEASIDGLACGLVATEEKTQHWMETHVQASVAALRADVLKEHSTCEAIMHREQRGREELQQQLGRAMELVRRMREDADKRESAMSQRLTHTFEVQLARERSLREVADQKSLAFCEETDVRQRAVVEELQASLVRSLGQEKNNIGEVAASHHGQNSCVALPHAVRSSRASDHADSVRPIDFGRAATATPAERVELQVPSAEAAHCLALPEATSPLPACVRLAAPDQAEDKDLVPTGPVAVFAPRPPRGREPPKPPTLPAPPVPLLPEPTRTDSLA